MNHPRSLKTTRHGVTSFCGILALALAVAAILAPAPNSDRSPLGAVSAYADCDTCGTAGHDPTGPGRP